MAVLGYARVSTNGQDTTGQVSALVAAGAERTFAEKLSGAKSASDRPQLTKVLRLLGPGDVLVVTRLDRLARSTRDLLNVVDAITKAGANFRSLADTWCDTTTPHGKLMLTVLGGLAEFERSLIHERTSAGIARARDKGVRFGRPARLNETMKLKIAERRAAGESIAAIAADYKCGLGTIHRALNPS